MSVVAKKQNQNIVSEINDDDDDDDDDDVLKVHDR